MGYRKSKHFAKNQLSKEASILTVSSDLESYDFEPLSIKGLTMILLGSIIALLVILLPSISVLLGRPLSQENEIIYNHSINKEWGEEQVHIWRRSYDIPPPGGESLKDTLNRVLPYFEKTIKPELDKKKNILVTAHGNSLRALIKKIENISSDDIVKLEIATGEPIIYSFFEERFTRLTV